MTDGLPCRLNPTGSTFDPEEHERVQRVLQANAVSIPSQSAFAAAFAQSRRQAIPTRRTRPAPAVQPADVRGPHLVAIQALIHLTIAEGATLECIICMSAMTAGMHAVQVPRPLSPIYLTGRS